MAETALKDAIRAIAAPKAETIAKGIRGLGFTSFGTEGASKALFFIETQLLDFLQAVDCLRLLHTDVSPDAVRQARRETAQLHQRMNEHEHVGLADGIFGGVTPVVSGIRISVHDILTYLYNGNSIQYIAETYGLTPEAIKDAIAFAQDVYDDAAAALRAEGKKGSENG